MTHYVTTAYRGHKVPSLRNLWDLGGSDHTEKDLLDLVPDSETVDLRTVGQVRFMDNLVSQITALDEQTGAQAQAYTARMTQHGRWTPGYEGNASRWIDRMLVKVRELRTAQGPAPATNQVQIPAGRYAVETDEIRCYSINYGKEDTRWAGYLFLDRISSDDRFAVKNPVEKARILEAIAADVDGAAILAGLTLRQCRRCGRTLSDTKNPYFQVALGPECGSK